MSDYGLNAEELDQYFKEYNEYLQRMEDEFLDEILFKDEYADYKGYYTGGEND